MGEGANKWGKTLITFRRNTLDLIFSLVISSLSLALFFFVFPDQIPPGIGGDFSSGNYPKAIICGLFILSVLIAILSIKNTTKNKNEIILIDKGSLWRHLYIFLVLFMTFLILYFMGFLIAGAFIILCYCWLLQERGRISWLLAFATPVVAFLFLEFALEVRLPTVFNGLLP